MPRHGSGSAPFAASRSTSILTTAVSCRPPRLRLDWSILGCSELLQTQEQQPKPLLRFAVSVGQLPAGGLQTAVSHRGRILLPAGGVLDWHNHKYRQSGIRFATPQLSYSGQVGKICRHRSREYEQASLHHSHPWGLCNPHSRLPEVICTYPPPPEKANGPAMFVRAARLAAEV